MARRCSDEFLRGIAAVAQSYNSRIAEADATTTEADIAARQVEREAGIWFAGQVDQIEAELRASGGKLNLPLWTRKETGADLRTWQRRKRLEKRWGLYVRRRRKLGECGQSGLAFALFLIRDPVVMLQQSDTGLSLVSERGTSEEDGPADEARCRLLTGDCREVLKILPDQSVNCVVASPWYWPAKRAGTGIGFETTLAEYLSELVGLFRQVRRVLRTDGVCWLVLSDSYSGSAGTWNTDRTTASTQGVVRVDSTYLRPAGNLLGIPSKLADALQDDGWYLRNKIIWRKAARSGKITGRPETVTNRHRRAHEDVLMLTREPTNYYFDADACRIPGTSSAATVRNADGRVGVTIPDALGVIEDSVWEIPVSMYRGGHKATFPVELARKCIACSCPVGGIVLDPFGGVATTALAALHLGMRAISIDINPAYTAEARQRLGREGFRAD